MRAPWAQPVRAPQGAPRAAAEGMPPSTFEWRGWSFNAPKGPILSTHDADSWTARLGMTLPEMVFGENKLEIKNAAQGLEFSFKAYEALDACAREVDVQVSVAQTWQANKEDLPEAQKFDWTYSTKYRGSTFKGGAHWEPESTDDKIDFESLKQRAGEDILWSADVILFEDELHDHGTSKLTVRVRVTQSYFYVLQRAFIRVDDMTIRLRETRLHHVFGREQSLRQYTEREERYGTIRQSCSSKQLAEGMLDDPDLLSPKLPVTLDVTEVLRHDGVPPKHEDVVSAIMKKEIARRNAEAEREFKRKYGNVRPSAGALLHRQRKHETRYFDSGDAFSGAGSKHDEPEPGPGRKPGQAALPVVQGQLEGADEAAIEAAEIARKNAEAEAKFKKKFGNAKPSAGALLHRQRQHETRYFDSGEAFSGVSKKEDPLASEDDTQGPLAVVQGQDQEAMTRERTRSMDEAEANAAAIEAAEIARKNAEAEAKFKKKFGNAKPSAGALLHRQRQHETRYFDSGDAFSGAGKKDDLLETRGEKRETLIVVQGQDSVGSDDETAEIARKNAEAEAKFKKKFGNAKPSAGALLHRQRQHETRYFDSGEAFSGVSKKEDPLASEDDTQGPLAVVQGQDQEAMTRERTRSMDEAEANAAAIEAAEIARKNAEAEAKFKKKFGNAKPSAGALLHRQRQHETRYFDSGDAFSGAGKKEDPLASDADTQGPLATVLGQ